MSWQSCRRVTLQWLLSVDLLPPLVPPELQTQCFSFLACSPPYQPALCQLECSHFWSATNPFQARHFILQAFNLLTLTRFPALPPHNGFPLACPPRIHLQHWLLLKFF